MSEQRGVQLNSKEQIERRKTFAIISHPDAGKTTLTEKLLLYSGVLREAGTVKAKAGKKAVTSDWMELERKRGISVTTTAIQFEYNGFCINLLDTPGHKDFSEDTYRTLMAVDAAVMLIDGAKGVEEQTMKLFQVCRHAGIPIFTFINKMDRETRNPVELINEIESVLGIACSPVNWPIGCGQVFQGVYDLRTKSFHVFDKSDFDARRFGAHAEVFGSIDELVALERFQAPFLKEAIQNFAEEVRLLDAAGDNLNEGLVSQGLQSPVFFGSAMNNFGIELFLEYFTKVAPAPVPREMIGGQKYSPLGKFSGVIFKIQANMDPHHRDCLAFMRICSGVFQKGLRVQIPRSNQEYRINNAFSIFGRDRTPIESAFAGDIVGIVDSGGTLKIGDTLAEEKNIEYKVWTRFLPEVFADIRLIDLEKRKQLSKGLEQLSEEGIFQTLFEVNQGNVFPTLGAIGELQFDVLVARLESEYSVHVRVQVLPYRVARILASGFESLSNSTSGEWRFVKDIDENILVLFQSEWSIRIFKNANPKAVLVGDYGALREIRAAEKI